MLKISWLSPAVVVAPAMLLAFSMPTVSCHADQPLVAPLPSAIAKSPGLVNALKLQREAVPVIAKDEVVVTSVKGIEQHIGKTVILHGIPMISLPSASILDCLPLASILVPTDDISPQFRGQRVYTATQFEWPRSAHLKRVIIKGTIESSQDNQKPYPDTIDLDYYIQIEWWALEPEGNMKAVQQRIDSMSDRKIIDTRYTFGPKVEPRGPLTSTTELIEFNSSITGTIDYYSKAGVYLKETSNNLRILYVINSKNKWPRTIHRKQVVMHGHLVLHQYEFIGQGIPGPHHLMWVRSWEFANPTPADDVKPAR